MRIQKISNSLNYKAKVDPNFVRNAENFYAVRQLPLQYNTFKNKVNLLEYYGDNHSVILHSVIQENEVPTHLLCLKNKLINKKEAVILAKTTKYNEILRFFTKINPDAIPEYEKYLAQI